MIIIMIKVVRKINKYDFETLVLAFYCSRCFQITYFKVKQHSDEKKLRETIIFYIKKQCHLVITWNKKYL